MRHKFHIQYYCLTKEDNTPCEVDYEEAKDYYPIILFASPTSPFKDVGLTY